MTNIVDEFRRDSARVLDRLADGELTEAEEKALLASLDDEPGGWRACSLALLEGRAWRREIGGLAVGSVVPAAASSASSFSTRPQHAPKGTWAAWLALAAAALAAISLGLRLRDSWSPTRSLARQPAASDNSLAAARPSAPSDSAASPTAPAEPSAVASRWETFRVGIGDTGESLELPGWSADGVDPEAFVEQVAPAPTAIVQALEDAGHRVKRARQLWPVPLDDGRKLVVPVEELEIQFVGNERYQ